MSRFMKPVKDKKDENGTMQVEIFPQRILNVETAQKLLDELNKVPGITRIVVFGPRLPLENPNDLLEGRYGAGEKKYLNIKGEAVELTVQVGKIWIELESLDVLGKIRAAGEKALPFPFELYEGIYIRTQPTVVDYAKGKKAGDISIGMFDPKDRRNRACCGEKPDDHEIA